MDVSPENAESESQFQMKLKRDQFAVQIRKKKNSDRLNSKRIRFSQMPDDKSITDYVDLMNADQVLLGLIKHLIVLIDCKIL